MELYKKYRPKTLQDVVGQADAVKSLERFIEKDNLPHALLLTGPSGVGKTTIARILRRHLKCSSQDFSERNCADFRGVDDVRLMRNSCDYMPIGGPTRIFLIDECHKLTNDAQNALLKLLEDTPKHVYFMLCTTDPQKLIKQIHTRCSQVKLAAMAPGDVGPLVKKVAKAEGFVLAASVVEDLVEAAEGSARKALVILEQIGGLDNEQEQRKVIQTTTYNKDAAIDLARLLMKAGGWVEIASVLKSLGDQEPEGIRYCVLGYARACLLGGSPIAPRAYMVIDIFSRNFYDSKHAGLAAACWEVNHAK